jgi:hypothetical protein
MIKDEEITERLRLFSHNRVRAWRVTGLLLVLCVEQTNSERRGPGEHSLHADEESYPGWGSNAQHKACRAHI